MSFMLQSTSQHHRLMALGCTGAVLSPFPGLELAVSTV